uniref:USP6 N-terminal like n=1 Tax=Paramormyrops kingsleyae TaxID=1676925 RepID=A0A3B3QZH4_9TELE
MSSEAEQDAVIKLEQERAEIVAKYDKGKDGTEVEPWEDANFRLYKVIDRFGFLHEIELPSSDSMEEKQKHLEMERTTKWLKMLKSWDKYKNTEKVSRQKFHLLQHWPLLQAIMSRSSCHSPPFLFNLDLLLVLLLFITVTMIDSQYVYLTLRVVSCTRYTSSSIAREQFQFSRTEVQRTLKIPRCRSYPAPNIKDASVTSLPNETNPMIHCAPKVFLGRQVSKTTVAKTTSTIFASLVLRNTQYLRLCRFGP